MMKPFEDLHEDHELITRMITVLEALNAGLADRRADAAVDLREAIRFVRGFADKCHHGKEERALFPLIAGKNATVARMPVRILTSEHEAGRILISRLENSLSGLEAGDERATAEASEAITLYTTMLRKHIAKEEDIVFPLAQTMITDGEAAALEEQFTAIEAEMGPQAHELYRGIVESLEQRTGIRAA
jgi:hemerythrin-like domain-containing protein